MPIGGLMADSYRARIPFESLDPLTIGASDDESKVYREELELEIPERNVLAAIYPDEPDPVQRCHGGGAPGARVADQRPIVCGAPERRRQRRRDHRQPVPAYAGVEALAASARRDRGRRGRRLRRHREREGLPTLGVGHRAEGRAREPRPDGESWVFPSSRTSRATRTSYTYIGVTSAARLSGSTTRSRGATSRSR